MITTNKKNRIAFTLLCILALTTATGSFASMAYNPCACKKVAVKKTVVIKKENKALPVMNPLQILSAKFL